MACSVEEETIFGERTELRGIIFVGGNERYRCWGGKKRVGKRKDAGGKKRKRIKKGKDDEKEKRKKKL